MVVTASRRFAVNVGSVTIAGLIGGVASGVFWIIAARRFPLGVIGDAGALVSLAAVINVLTSLGFNGAVLRNVPSRHGNGGLLLSGACTSAFLSVMGSLLVAGVFAVSATTHNSSFSFVHLLVVLSLLSGSAAISVLVDGVGAPMGNVWLAPLRGVVVGATRIAWLLLVTRGESAFGVDLIYAVPVAISCVAALTILAIQSALRDRSFRPSAEQRRSFWHYAVHSLPSTIVLTIVPAAPPAIAVWIMGAKSGAVFYICWNGFVLANLLVAAATSLGVSPDVDSAHLIRAVRVTVSICSAGVVLGGPVLLLLYGTKYFDGGWLAIALLGLALLPYSQEQLQITLLRRAREHTHTTRIALSIGLAGAAGLFVGASLGSPWTMSMGWLLGVSSVLVIGSFGSNSSALTRWLPAVPRLPTGA